MKVLARTAMVLLLTTGAFLILGVGYFLAQVVWYSADHRYETPDTGAYYGSVSATFTRIGDTVYNFSFQGKTKPRWYWHYPTNFTYSTLEIGWRGNGSKGIASVQLPTLAYRSSNTTGVLTRGILAQWLVGNTNTASPEDLSGVDFIYGYVDAAGRGSLPPPSHHGHYFTEPAIGHIQHFLLGYGVGWPAVVWGVVWLAAVILTAPWVWRRCEGNRPSEDQVVQT